MTESKEVSHLALVKEEDPPPEPERQKMKEEEVMNSQQPPEPRSTFTLKASTLEPYYRDPDPEAPEYFDDMAEFYLEAARRLPIAQMPKLAGVLSLGGLLLGLNEPVINIIVNAMFIMAKFGSSVVLPQGTDPVRHAADRASYVGIARKSRAALVVFMIFYFRHLTEAQAKRYLRAARHDLALAIGLVECHRKGLDVHHLISQTEPVEQLGEMFDDLHPDCARTKTALRYAVPAAMLLHDPDDLMRLLASRYQRQLLDPVLDDLRRGEKLSVDRVNDILNLLRHPWSPPPPPPPPLPAPTPGTFHDEDGNVTIIANIGQDLFSTTKITRDRAQAFSASLNDDLVTTTTISRHHPSGHGDDGGFRDTGYLTTDPDKKIRFHAFLRSSTAAQQLRPDMNSITMCLLDTIHGFYIQALTMLPPSDHLLHAVLQGGYCYGVMYNPVHNIIVNSIWYSLHYPPPKDSETLQIHHTSSMTPIASCSLNALIALVDSAPSITRKKQEAVLYLNTCNCCFRIEEKSHQLVVAAHATKHPQPSVLVEFMELLFPLRDRITNLLSSKHALSNADFETISKLIAANKALMPTTSDLYQPAPTTSNPCQPASVDPPDFWVQAYVREKLEELLFNYGSKDPLVKGPQYKLGIICGVESKICSSYHRGIRCYHANFLASTADVPGSILFFAEFWNQADDDFEQSKMPPICWPITHRISYHCRCFICESAAIKIVHPFDVNYFMGHRISTDSICALAEHEAALGGMKMESGICL